MAQGESARLSASARHVRPVSKYQPAATAIARGRKRHDENMPRLKMTCQMPGSIHCDPGTKRMSTNVTRPPTAADGQKLLDGHADHLVRHAGMNAPGAGVHLGSNQGGGKSGGPDPDAQVRGNMIGRIRQPKRLNARGSERQRTRTGKGCGAVTAKLRTVGNLPANAADVAQRFVQVVHAGFTLHCKVKQFVGVVNCETDGALFHSKCGIPAPCKPSALSPPELFWAIRVFSASPRPHLCG
jgi:hypothetical protein